MKLHWLWILLIVVGILFILHNYQSHGGVAGVKQGLGFSGLGG